MMPLGISMLETSGDFTHDTVGNPFGADRGTSRAPGRGKAVVCARDLRRTGLWVVGRTMAVRTFIFPGASKGSDAGHTFDVIKLILVQ